MKVVPASGSLEKIALKIYVCSEYSYVGSIAKRYSVYFQQCNFAQSALSMP